MATEVTAMVTAVSGLAVIASAARIMFAGVANVLAVSWMAWTWVVPNSTLRCFNALARNRAS
jgi:hypothetical protein